MPDRAVDPAGVHIEPVGARRARRRGRRGSELATEGFPLVPGTAVPVAIPQLAVVHDGEDLHLALGPGRHRGTRGQLAAEGFGRLPSAGDPGSMPEATVRLDPEQIEPPRSPAGGCDPAGRLKGC